jgi:hypothetical protein
VSRLAVMVAATEGDKNNKQDVRYNRSTAWQGRVPLNNFDQ